MRGGPGAPSTARSSGSVGWRIPDVRRVRHSYDDSAVHVYLPRRVGANSPLSCSPAVNMDNAVGLSLLQPLSCLEKSGSCVAGHTVAALRSLHSGDLARIWNHYFSGARRLRGRHAIYGRASLALPDRVPDYDSP